MEIGLVSRHLSLSISDSLALYDFLYLPSNSAIQDFSALMKQVYSCELTPDKSQVRITLNGKDIQVKQFVKGIELRSDTSQDIPVQTQQFLLTSKIILAFNLLDKDVQNLKEFNSQQKDEAKKVILVDDRSFRIHSFDSKVSAMFESYNEHSDTWNSIIKLLMSNAYCMVLSGADSDKSYLLS